MRWFVTAACLGALLVLAPQHTVAQDAKPKAPAKATADASPKAGSDQKVCRYKFPDGEKRTWTCDKAVPCCAWDAIKYVKCGTTFSGCL